jgi:hypothetical protein
MHWLNWSGLAALCGDRHLEIVECSRRLQQAFSAARPAQTLAAWRFEGDPFLGRPAARVFGLAFFLPTHVGFIATAQWTPIGDVMSLSVAMHSSSLPSDSNRRASVSAALIFFSTSSSARSTV